MSGGSGGGFGLPARAESGAVVSAGLSAADSKVAGMTSAPAPAIDDVRKARREIRCTFAENLIGKLLARILADRGRPALKWDWPSMCTRVPALRQKGDD
jgi:hypothetical protein